MRPISKFARAQDGGTLVETSISLMALLAIFLGTMEFCRALYADLYVGYAAHAAARYAMVRGSSWNGASCTTSAAAACTATSSDVAGYVQSIAPLGIGNASGLAVTPTWPGTDATGAACIVSSGTNSPGCIVRVQVVYNFRFVMPFMPINMLRLASTSAVTISQ